MLLDWIVSYVEAIRLRHPQLDEGILARLTTGWGQLGAPPMPLANIQVSPLPTIVLFEAQT